MHMPNLLHNCSMKEKNPKFQNCKSYPDKRDTLSVDSPPDCHSHRFNNMFFYT